MNVLLVDDQKLFRDGLLQLLKLWMPQWHFTAVASVTEAEALFTDGSIDAILSDVSMPNVNGIDWVATLRERAITTPVIILSTFGDHELILKAITSGANGYLLKDVAVDILIAAIEAVVKGESVYSPAMTFSATQGLANQYDDSLRLIEPLTDRELEVLRCVANGFSNREIAKVLHKSEGTVKNQVAQLLSKLGVRDRTRAVLKAAEMGLLTENR